ncbi:NAD(P)-binding oxidoreductase [Streptomyces misionensis]|uniref:NAD(P)-dependent oxidoreductase n=1 Tax=Streptomyces misionensis TaxID=67331 RepID=UPI0033EBEA51
MRIAILGATGATGRLLVGLALDRGHQVTALVRNPARLGPDRSPQLQTAMVDLTDHSAVAAALDGSDAVVSALGNVKGAPPGILTTGAAAVAAAGPRTVVWLGAFGTGGSAMAAGALTRRILRLALGTEIADKTAADDLVLAMGGTVVHAGPLTNGAAHPDPFLRSLVATPRSILPRPVSRATVAAAMLREAEHPQHGGQITIP